MQTGETVKQRPGGRKEHECCVSGKERRSVSWRERRQNAGCGQEPKILSWAMEARAICNLEEEGCG